MICYDAAKPAACHIHQVTAERNHVTEQENLATVEAPRVYQ